MSENAKEEELPRDDIPFDYNAKPNKFYMDVETDGSLEAQEVVHKVGVDERFEAHVLCTPQSTRRYRHISSLLPRKECLG